MVFLKHVRRVSLPVLFTPFLTAMHWESLIEVPCLYDDKNTKAIKNLWVDIKSENILLDFDFETDACSSFSLCDFGIATFFNENTICTEYCGSSGFFSPEMVLNERYAPSSNDMWGIGAILLEMVLGHAAFEKNWMFAYREDVLHEAEVFFGQINHAVADLPDLLKQRSFSSDLQDVLMRLLDIDPGKRMRMAELQKHPWIADAMAQSRPKNEDNEAPSPTDADMLKLPMIEYHRKEMS